jgi:hypothetical protein
MVNCHVEIPFWPFGIYQFMLFYEMVVCHMPPLDATWQVLYILIIDLDIFLQITCYHMVLMSKCYYNYINTQNVWEIATCIIIHAYQLFNNFHLMITNVPMIATWLN